DVLRCRSERRAESSKKHRSGSSPEFPGAEEAQRQAAGREALGSSLRPRTRSQTKAQEAPILSGRRAAAGASATRKRRQQTIPDGGTAPPEKKSKKPAGNSRSSTGKPEGVSGGKTASEIIPAQEPVEGADMSMPVSERTRSKRSSKTRNYYDEDDHPLDGLPSTAGEGKSRSRRGDKKQQGSSERGRGKKGKGVAEGESWRSNQNNSSVPGETSDLPESGRADRRSSRLRFRASLGDLDPKQRTESPGKSKGGSSCEREYQTYTAENKAGMAECHEEGDDESEYGASEAAPSDFAFNASFYGMAGMMMARPSESKFLFQIGIRLKALLLPN
ncbi:MAG: hypothetical protein BJ554DRAFT_4507, partial [Olpidium bornovanus]